MGQGAGQGGGGRGEPLDEPQFSQYPSCSVAVPTLPIGAKDEESKWGRTKYLIQEPISAIQNQEGEKTSEKKAEGQILGLQWFVIGHQLRRETKLKKEGNSRRRRKKQSL